MIQRVLPDGGTIDMRRGAGTVIAVDRDAGTIDVDFWAWCLADDLPLRIPIPAAMPTPFRRPGFEFTCLIPIIAGHKGEAGTRARAESLLSDPEILDDFRREPLADVPIEDLERMIDGDEELWRKWEAYYSAKCPDSM
jgi:hypothetical protein